MDRAYYKTFTTSRNFTYSYYCHSPSDVVESVISEPPLPALLFLHGFPTSSRIWKHQVKYFTERGFPILAVDLLGFGGTSKPRDVEAYRASLICKDIIELLDSEGIRDGEVIAIGHDLLSLLPQFAISPDANLFDWRGSKIVSRFASFYPDRCRAYGFLADPYYPPRPMQTLEFTLMATKKMAGYELCGHCLFYAEDGASELIEKHLDSFLSAMFPKNPTVWAIHVAPVGALKAWLKRDSKSVLASHIDAGDLQMWRTALSIEGVDPALCYYKAYISGLTAEDDKVVPLDRYSVEKPVFFAAASHDYISQSLLGSALTRHHCKNATIREFCDGHWLMLSSPSEVNSALLSWIMDCP